MDIKLELLINSSEVDNLIQRLIFAMSPSLLHGAAAKLAENRVKGRYRERFKAQVNNDSYWQQAKRDVSFGLAEGGEPGFLTGTTFNSITSSSDAIEGVVFLRGAWPQGEGCAAMYSSTGAESGSGAYSQGAPKKYFKWGENQGKPGLEFFISPGYQVRVGHGVDYGSLNNFGRLGRVEATPAYIGGESLATKKYGPPGKEIQWMILDPSDVSFILKGLYGYLAEFLGDTSVTSYSMMLEEDAQSELRKFLEGAKTKVRKPPSLPKSDVATGGDSNKSRLDEIAARFDMPIDEIMAQLGAKTEAELIRKIDIHDELNDFGED